MSSWFKRFGLHLAAAVGATGIFVAAAAVGASQTHQPAPAAQTVSVAPSPRPTPRRATSAGQSATPAPTTEKVAPERSLAGSVTAVGPDGLDVLGAGGHRWRVVPAPGALIRLNGKAARLDTLQVGDGVVILGQAQANRASGGRFLAHAITARRK